MKKETLCAGVVGAGAISDIYLKNMTGRYENLRVKSICAGHIESAQKKAALYGLQAVTMEEMLEDPEIDLVVNLTPAHAHYKIIKAALEHGKHVYTEKTMTDDLKKSEELVRLAKEKGLCLGSAPDTFLGASFQTAREVIDDGLLGEINSFVISGNRNNDILLSAFGFLREPGGGIVCDYGVYYMTVLAGLLGPVARVGGIVRAPYKTHVNIIPGNPLFGQVMDTPNESEVSAIIKMQSGVVGTFHINADSAMADEAYFLIYGTKGILSLPDPNQFGREVTFLPQPPVLWERGEPVVLTNFSNRIDNLRGIGPSDLADAVLNDRPVRPSKEMAYHVHEVLTAILQGGEKGAFVDIQSSFERPEPLPLSNPGITKMAHLAFNVKDMDTMIRFYDEALGMKKLFTLTIRDWYESMEESKKNLPEGEDPFIDRLRSLGDTPWIVYLGAADGQFLELFYHIPGLDPEERTFIPDRRENYGYLKLNFEVKSIEAIRDHLVSKRIDLIEDIHTTADGAREIVIRDPEGNEVQFTEYPDPEKARIKMEKEPGRKEVSCIEYITQAAFQVKDEVNMLRYYTKGLGLKHVDRLTFKDLAEYLAAKSGSEADEQLIAELRIKGDRPWIDYIEAAPHQYIELFYTGGLKKEECRQLGGYYGYQHICFETADIQASFEAVKENGIVPDTGVSLGCDGTWQFWLTDPDGNRMEFHQYTEKSLQLK